MAGIGFHPKESSRWAPAVYSSNSNPPPGLRTRGNPPQAGQATPPVPTPGSEAGRCPGFGARGDLPFGSDLCREGVGGALTLLAPRAPALFSEPAAHPPEKLSWRRVARGGHRGPRAGSAPPAGLSALTPLATEKYLFPGDGLQWPPKPHTRPPSESRDAREIKIAP